MLNAALLILLASSAFSHASFSPTAYTGTKAPYVPPTAAAMRNAASEVAGLTLISATVIQRHGTRYPNTNDFKKSQALATFVQAIAKNATELGKEFAWMQDWSSPFSKNTSDMGQLFYPTGARDMQGRADRDMQRFGVYPNTVALASFDVQSTKVKRAQDSAHEYINHIFPDPASRPKVRVFGDDSNLNAKEGAIDGFRVWHECPTWQKHINFDEELRKSMEQHIEKYYAPIAQRLSKSIGNGVDFPTRLVRAAFIACAFSLALYGNTRSEPMCNMFTEEEWNVYRYVEQTAYYHHDGPGRALNGRVMCRTFKELVDAMDAAVAAKSDAPTMVLRFNHAETVMKLGIAVGVYPRHTPPRLNDTLTSAPGTEQRQFDLSRDLPFAANLIFELYRAADGGVFIRVLLNERVIPVPRCGANVTLCPFETFKEANRIAMTCDLDEVCRLKGEEVGWVKPPKDKTAKAA